jgi:CRISPR-associated protein Cas1
MPSEIASSKHWLSMFRPGAILTVSGLSPSLTVSDGCLVVKPGLTLANDPPDSLIYARGVHSLKVVVIDSQNGLISLPAIRWLTDQSIECYVITSHQQLTAVVSRIPKPVVQLRRAQYTASPLALAKSILGRKLAACVRELPELDGNPCYGGALSGGLDACLTLNDLLLVEGRAAGAYWGLRAFTLKHFKKWPKHWDEFDQRSSGLAGGNRHATHPINAVLNYGYGVLAARIKQRAFIFGLDTAAGFLHADNGHRDSLVYDLIEPLRPVIDSRLLGWAKVVKWRRTDFMVNVKGVVTLDDNLKKIVVDKAIGPGGLAGRDIDQEIKWMVKRLLIG